MSLRHCSLVKMQSSAEEVVKVAYLPLHSYVTHFDLAE